MALAVPTAVQASGHPRQPQGRLVFVGLDSSFSQELYSSKPDGSDVRQVTHLPAGSRVNDPEWSPDGARVAFRAKIANRYEILVMNSDGTAMHAITHDSSFNSQPEWSPDGAEIAFASRQTGTQQIWVVDADGGQEHQLTTGPGEFAQPAWAPDGRWIACSGSGSGSEQIYRLRTDGTDLSRLAHDSFNDSTPDWSPNGRRIAFDSDRTGGLEIWTMTREGSDARQLTVGAPAFSIEPVWSPNGRELSFWSDRNDVGNGAQLFRMRAAGADVIAFPLPPGIVATMRPDWAAVPSDAEGQGE